MGGGRLGGLGGRVGEEDLGRLIFDSNDLRFCARTSFLSRFDTPASPLCRRRRGRGMTRQTRRDLENAVRVPSVFGIFQTISSGFQTAIRKGRIFSRKRGPLPRKNVETVVSKCLRFRTLTRTKSLETQTQDHSISILAIGTR